MTLPIYVAMTAAEYANCPKLPANICWMACYFSSYNTGLSNIPDLLPENSILMVNDQYMPTDHDPSVITHQLQKAAEVLRLKGMIMDMQHPHCPMIQSLCDHLSDVLPCPVAVTPHYALNRNGPVFVPPIPPNRTAKDYLSPYSGKEVWLELERDSTQFTITEGGCSVSKTNASLPQTSFKDEILHCHYHMFSSENAAIFTLQRTEEDQRLLLSEAQKYGTNLAVEFYRKT